MAAGSSPAPSGKHRAFALPSQWLFNLGQFALRLLKVNLCLAHCRADIAGDVQVVVVLLDLFHLHPAGIAGRFLAELVGLDDLGNVLLRQLVLALAFDEVLGGVDGEHVVGFFDGKSAQLSCAPSAAMSMLSPSVGCG